MKKLSLTILILLFAVSGIHAQLGTDMKAKFSKMNQKFAKLMLEEKTDELFENYTDDCISMPSYQPMIRGMKAIKEAQEKMEKSGAKMTEFKINTTDVIPAGNYYIDIGTWAMTMNIPGMKEPFKDHGKYMNVWEKQKDGSFKIKVDTWNSDVNPYQMMQGKHDDSGHHDKDDDSMGKPNMNKKN